MIRNYSYELFIVYFTFITNNMYIFLKICIIVVEYPAYVIHIKYKSMFVRSVDRISYFLGKLPLNSKSNLSNLQPVTDFLSVKLLHETF